MFVLHRMRGVVLLGALGLLVGVGLAGAGHAAPGGAAPAQGAAWDLPTWGPDIRLSPPFTNTPSIQTNTILAVNPANPQQVIAGYDSLDSTTNSAVGWSSDAGRTWTGARFYGSWVPGTDLQPNGTAGVGFDHQGVAYYASQAVGNTLNGYFVLTSTLGQPWHTPVPVAFSDYTQYRDQGRMAVDGGASGPYAGSLYLGWRYTDTTSSQVIQVSSSHDGGQTWSAAGTISDPNRGPCAAPVLAVAGDGTVYLAYAEAPPPRLELPVTFYLDRSTDGGATWGVDQMIGGGPIRPIGALDVKGRTLVLLGDANNGAALIDNVPALAIDPDHASTVYVTWNDGRWERSFNYYGRVGQDGDIAFSRSTDGGASWTAPQRINDDPLANGVDQFSPAIATGPDGVIGITWYDRRDDPAGFLYNLYYSQSTDGGQTWSANQRVSDVSSDPMAIHNQKGEGYPLGFNGLVYGPDYVLPGWVDTRAGMSDDIFTDRGQIAAPPVTPSATPTGSPATLTRTPTVVPSNTATRTASPSSAPGSLTPTRTPTVGPSSTPGGLMATASATASPHVTVTACPIQFSDVSPGDPFYPYIRCLACRNILSGYTTSPPCATGQTPCYNGGANVTRGQVAKIVSNAAGYVDPIPSTQQTFSDVLVSSPFWVYVERLAEPGRQYISGYSTSPPCATSVPCFLPFNNVTRGQMAKIGSNAGGYFDAIPSTQQTFTDVPYGNPFWVYVERASLHGVISGYSTSPPCTTGVPCFLPGSNLTRNQAAKVVAVTFYPNCQTPAKR